jgi:hypothetical protein
LRPHSDLPHWTVSDEPILEVGLASGAIAYELHWVTGAVRLSDNRIALANSGSREIRFFDLAGGYQGSVGGEGEGPGEYQLLSAIWPAEGDSLAVWDDRAKRVTILDNNGNLGRTARPKGAGFYMSMAGVLGDGSWIMKIYERRHGGRDYTINSMELQLHSRTGHLEESLGTFPRWEMKRLGSVLGGRLFSWRSSLAVGPDLVWYGDSREYEVRAIDRNGATRIIVRWLGPDRTIQPHHVEAYWTDQLGWAAANDAYSLGKLSELRGEVDVAACFPAYDRLYVDAVANLWIRDFERPGEDKDQMWTVFSPDGQMSAAVFLRPGARILAAGADYMITAELDDLDVEHVRMYRLIRST